MRLPSNARPALPQISAETQGGLSHLQTDAIAVMDVGSGFSSQESSAGLLPRRFRRKSSHPVTPDKNKACSKRTFDGMVRSWVLALDSIFPHAVKNITPELCRQEGVARLSRCDNAHLLCRTSYCYIISC